MVETLPATFDEERVSPPLQLQFETPSVGQFAAPTEQPVEQFPIPGQPGLVGQFVMLPTVKQYTIPLPAMPGGSMIEGLTMRALAIRQGSE